MAAGHITRHTASSRIVKADMRRKHARFPLGMRVLVKTPEGYMKGKVSKHWRPDEYRHGCSIEFPFPISMGDANGKRYSHVIPFRSVKPIENTPRYGFQDNGMRIVAPAGWRMLHIFEPVTGAHRNSDENGKWCQPHVGPTTMTPFFADVCGWVRAIAVPV